MIFEKTALTLLALLFSHSSCGLPINCVAYSCHRGRLKRRLVRISGDVYRRFEDFVFTSLKIGYSNI